MRCNNRKESQRLCPDFSLTDHSDMPFVSPSHVVIGTDESYRAGRPGAPDQVAIRGPTVLALAAPLDEA